MQQNYQLSTKILYKVTKFKISLRNHPIKIKLKLYTHLNSYKNLHGIITIHFSLNLKFV